MAGKYYHEGSDITTLCEPQYHTAADGFGTADSSLFKGEGPFQKAGSDTTNITLDRYKVDGTAVTTVKKGYYPVILGNCASSSKVKVWSSYTPGTYTIKRTDAALTIGSTSIPASSFRNGTVPYEVIVFLVGGGGSGGGCGYNKKQKLWIPGGAGGGGGLAVARVTLGTTNSLTIGSYGTDGDDGASGKDSNGGAGGSGGTTSFSVDGTIVVKATGGGGGGGGDSEGASGEGGTGGSGSASGTAVRNSAVAIGGAGSSWADDGSVANGGLLRFLPYSGTGASYVTVSSLKDDGKTNYAYEDNEYWFPGGNSFGHGAYADERRDLYGAEYGGGGGIGGTDYTCRLGGYGYACISY